MVGNKTAGRGFPTLEIKVKICGDSEKDIDLVNKLLPDYVGFVFAESRRKVRLEEAKKMALDLNPAIKKVGVLPMPLVSLSALRHRNAASTSCSFTALKQTVIGRGLPNRSESTVG